MALFEQVNLKARGRFLAVQFVCTRCGKTETIRAENLYDLRNTFYLHQTTPPSGWLELYNEMLCPACAEAYREFMKGGADNVG